MSKFKNGDKIRLKAGVTGWSGYTGVVWEFPYEDVDGISVGKLVMDWENDFELAEPSPEKHIHYDMIVQWAANPSRVVQYCDNYSDVWDDCVDNPKWTETLRYRFKPEEPERVFPTTSLTDNELTTLFDVTLGGVADALRAIANAAIKCYILEQEGNK